MTLSVWVIYIFCAFCLCLSSNKQISKTKNVLNPFPSKGFLIDEWNRLALDRLKSISALSAHAAVKGLIDSQPDECSYYVLKIVVNLSLDVPIKKDSNKKRVYERSISATSIYLNSG